MSDTDNSELMNKASDPATPGLELQQLATNPELRPLIAKNPAAYTGLLDWLVGKNEPEVIAALCERQQMFAQGMPMPMPSLGLPPTSPEGVLVNPVSSSETSNKESSEDFNATSVAESPESEPHPTGKDGSNAVSEPDESIEDSSSEPTKVPTRTSILGNTSEETTVLSSSSAEPSSAGSQTDSELQLPPSYAPGSGANSETYSRFSTTATGGTTASSQTTVMAPAEFHTTPNYATNSNYATTPSADNSTDFAEEKPKSNTVLWIIFGILLVLVICLAVALIVAFLGSQDDSTADSGTSSTANETSQSSEVDATDS